MSIALLLALVGADFPVCTAPNFTGYPSVCWTGDNYAVFWVDQRHRPNMSIYAARVSRDGAVLDSGGVEIYTDSAGYRCSAAFDGENFLVVTRNYC